PARLWHRSARARLRAGPALHRRRALGRRDHRPARLAPERAVARPRLRNVRRAGHPRRAPGPLLADAQHAPLELSAAERRRIGSRREAAALKPAWRQVHVAAKWPVRLLLVGLLLTVHLGPARAQDVPYLVKDINTATDDSSPDGLTDVNGTLFFVASDPTNGRELWKSDGTAAGTVLVKDIHPGSGDSSPYGLTDVNGTLFF